MRRKIAVSDADLEAILDCAEGVQGAFEAADDTPRSRQLLRSARRLRELVQRAGRVDATSVSTRARQSAGLKARGSPGREI